MRSRVFVFDDNELIRSSIANFLEGLGYEVHSYPEPAHCPVYLNHSCGCKHKYACTDIIITDIEMPGMTGIDFIEKQETEGE